MNKTQIIDYINHTPENTNPKIVRQFLDNYAKTISEFYVNGNPVKETDYLYKLTYTTVNYKAGEEYTKHYKLNGGCSSIRKGNLYGRNFDWLYNNNCSFIIEVKGNENRHASIGVSGHLRGLDKDFCSGMKWSDLYEILPSLTVDGINDAGVVANINVVPANTMGSTIGTNPGKPDLCLMSIVRLILDKCDTARDAIELVNQYNCFAPLRGDIAEEIHCMVADETSTYVIEFINNKVYVISDQDDEFDDFALDKPIMTNFHLYGFDGNVESIEKFGQGVERYMTLADAYDNEFSGAVDMMELMTSINFSNTYNEDMDPFWKSEYVGDYRQYGWGVYTNDTPLDEMWPMIEKEINKWEHRDRNSNTTLWHSVHNTVYDLTNRAMHVCSQEDDTMYTYYVDGWGEQT